VCVVTIAGDAMTNRVKRYRDRAESLRAMAVSRPADNGQQTLLALAIEYDRLAEVLERSAFEPRPGILAVFKP
jgi:hypothetical protein